MEKNKFGNDESISGEGSTLEATREIRNYLKLFIQQKEIKSITDIPCGDAHWMGDESFFNVKYVGIDIVEDLVNRNREKYSEFSAEFYCKNIIEEPLGLDSEIIICRDLLVHLSLSDCLKVFHNLSKENSSYIALTSFTRTVENTDLLYPSNLSNSVGWRPLNLELSPFNFGEPELLINEKCQERDGERVYDDKCLVIYRLENILSKIG
jgi:hypothetical protein